MHSGTLVRDTEVTAVLHSQRTSNAKGIFMSSRHHTFGTFAYLRGWYDPECLQLVQDNIQMHFVYCTDIEHGHIGDSKSIPLNTNGSIMI